MWPNKADFSKNTYTQDMERLTRQYNNLVLSAERCRRDNFGKVTLREAEFYDQAIKTCEQIMHLNLSERAVHTKWLGRKKECQRIIDEIADILAPKPPVVCPPPVEEKTPVQETNPPAASGTKKSGGTTKTESGFVTKNACADVKAETIEKWHKEKPWQGFNDVTGMESLKERLMRETAQYGWDRVDSQLKISPVQSYFFYGPPGTGKTFLIRAFAHEMMEKNENFHFIQLKGGDIHASLVGVAEKTVQIAFQEAVDNEPCLIFIDEIENVCVSRSKSGAEGHATRLTVAFLEAYNILLDSGKRVIFMGATNHPGQVDEAMMDRIKLIKVPLPDEPARQNYFTKAFENLVLEEGFTIDDMVEATDNHSYRDLNRLSESIAFKMKEDLIEDYRVFDEDGKLDQDASDLAASKALSEGKVLLTRVMFEKIQKENPPSDKSKIEAELKAFEDRTARQE